MDTVNKRLPLLALVAFLAVGPMAAIGFSGISPRFGVILEMAPSLHDPTDATGLTYVGGPPLITYFLGVGAPFELGSLFTWEPALDFYMGYYEWSEGYARALATEQSWRTSFTMAFLLQSPFVLDLPIGRDWKVGLGLGPAFNLRASLLAAMTEANAALYAADIPKINSYFYGQGRWFMPETFFRVGYRLTDRVTFSFSAIAFWPLANAWIKPELALDEGIFGGELRVRAALK